MTVVADAERGYTITIDTDRASAIEPSEVEAAVRDAHNQAAHRLLTQMQQALPDGADRHDAERSTR